jgi:hypothetical protein
MEKFHTDYFRLTDIIENLWQKQLTKMQYDLDVIKDSVMEQPSSLVWTEVVKKAVEKISGGTISKQGPNSSDSKKWSADNGALSVDLNFDWRVTFAVAKDDTTVLMAHVFYSTQKAQRQYGDYSCVIGARKDIDPPEYKIYKIRVHGKKQDDVADHDDDDVCNVCGKSFEGDTNALKQHLESKELIATTSGDVLIQKCSLSREHQRVRYRRDVGIWLAEGGGLFLLI